MADMEVIYGIHAVQAALDRPGTVGSLWLQAGRHDRRVQKLVGMAEAQGIPVKEVSRRALSERLHTEAHQGVAAFTGPSAPSRADTLTDLLAQIAGPPLLLVLDGVQDPHNLGACLRTAVAAGAHGVIAPRDRAVGITPAVRKVASGAAELIPFVQVTNLARALETLQRNGLWIVGTDGGAPTSLFDVDLTGPLALVMGGEGKGLRRLTKSRCDYLAAIPLLGGIESLNVSVAAGVCLFEIARQRRRIP